MKIIDDEYVNITDDIEKVQKKPTLYISFTGAEGVEHLAKEMVNNIIDEHLNPNTISDGTAKIYIDMEEGLLTFEDHGRGIPFDELENTCTILQSGSKMDRVNGESAGENGVGLTVTNALSEMFMITSTRAGKSKFIKFLDGKKVEERIIDMDPDKHGLTVTFKASKYFLGNNVGFPVETFSSWLKKLSFFMASNLVIHVTVHTDKLNKYMVYDRPKDGLTGFISYVDPNATVLGANVVLSSIKTSLVEHEVPIRVTDKRKKNYGEIEFVDFNRNLKVDISFNYTTDDTDSKVWAFCNNIENIEGGVHQDAVLSAIGTVFIALTKESLKKNETFEITQKDVLSGLRLVVNLETDYSTKFTSQTKHKLGNKELYKPIRNMVVDQLSEFLKSSQGKKIATKICEIVKLNAQIRLNVLEKKKKIKNNTMSFMDSKLIVGYDPANLVGKCKNGEELELYIVEGTSAGDTCRTARFNNDVQGVLATFGKPSNVYGKSSKEVELEAVQKSKKSKKDSDTDGKETAKFFHVLMDDILGCGYGSHFDIDKLKYKKIILGSDADIDGQHIMGINVGNFYKHARPLIEAGCVYRALAPLYLIRTGKRNAEPNAINRDAYVFTKKDLYEMFEARASEKIGIRVEGEAGIQSPEATKKFLEINRDYFEILHTAAKRYKISPDIIEFIVEHRDSFKNPGFLEKNLDKELHYNESRMSLYGCYKGAPTNLIMDKLVQNTFDDLRKIYIEGNSGIMHIHYYRRNNKMDDMTYIGYMTIGQIMADAQQYAADIITRFKGYGEMSGEEMRELVMNPDNRVLIRLVLDDDEKNTKEVFDTLFLKTASKQKKEYIKSMKLDMDDIDN